MGKILANQKKDVLLWNVIQEQNKNSFENSKNTNKDVLDKIVLVF